MNRMGHLEFARGIARRYLTAAPDGFLAAELFYLRGAARPAQQVNRYTTVLQNVHHLMKLVSETNILNLKLHLSFIGPLLERVSAVAAAWENRSMPWGMRPAAGGRGDTQLTPHRPSAIRTGRREMARRNDTTASPFAADMSEIPLALPPAAKTRSVRPFAAPLGRRLAGSHADRLAVWPRQERSGTWTGLPQRFLQKGLSKEPALWGVMAPQGRTPTAKTGLFNLNGWAVWHAAVGVKAPDGGFRIGERVDSDRNTLRHVSHSGPMEPVAVYGKATGAHFGEESRRAAWPYAATLFAADAVRRQRAGFLAVQAALPPTGMAGKHLQVTVLPPAAMAHACFWRQGYPGSDRRLPGQGSDPAAYVMRPFWGRGHEVRSRRDEQWLPRPLFARTDQAAKRPLRRGGGGPRPDEAASFPTAPLAFRAAPDEAVRLSASSLAFPAVSVAALPYAWLPPAGTLRDDESRSTARQARRTPVGAQTFGRPHRPDFHHGPRPTTLTSAAFALQQVSPAKEGSPEGGAAAPAEALWNTGIMGNRTLRRWERSAALPNAECAAIFLTARREGAAELFPWALPFELGGTLLPKRQGRGIIEGRTGRSHFGERKRRKQGARLNAQEQAETQVPAEQAFSHQLPGGNRYLWRRRPVFDSTQHGSAGAQGRLGTVIQGELAPLRPTHVPGLLLHRRQAATDDTGGPSEDAPDIAFIRRQTVKESETREEKTERVFAGEMTQSAPGAEGIWEQAQSPEAVSRLADKVYRVLERRLRTERMRKGLL